MYRSFVTNVSFALYLLTLFETRLLTAIKGILLSGALTFQQDTVLQRQTVKPCDVSFTVSRSVATKQHGRHPDSLVVLYSVWLKKSVGLKF